jgi:hypothetical protein
LSWEQSWMQQELDGKVAAGQDDPELRAQLTETTAKLEALHKKGQDAKMAGPVGQVAAEYEDKAELFDDLRNEYAQVYEVSPEFQNQFTGQLMSAAGGMVPQAVAAVLPGVGVTALQSQAFQYSWDDARAAAERQGVAFDPEKAFAYAMTNSFQQALLEKAGVDVALGKWMKEGGEKTIKEVLKRVAVGAAGEGTTEATQGAGQDTLAGVFGIEERNPLDPSKRGTEFGIGFILGGGMGGIHAGGEMLEQAGGGVQASGPEFDWSTAEVDLSGLEGATSQEQFENLSAKAGQPVETQEAPLVDEEGDARFAPKEETEAAPEVEEDPFAIEGEAEVETEGYVPGGDVEADAAAMEEAERRIAKRSRRRLPTR